MRLVVRHRWAVIVTAVIAMVLTVPAYFRLGSEFMPPLNEGAILYMPTAPPGMSDAEASRILQQMDRELIWRVEGRIRHTQIVVAGDDDEAV